MKHLVKNNPEGYKEVQGEPKNSNGPLRPWALTPDGQVVYSEWKPQAGGIQGMMDLVSGKISGKQPLRTYDRAASQMRRREFETLMAADAAQHPACCITAVNAVSTGLRNYLNERQQVLGTGTDVPALADDCVKARCYNDTGSGRLGTLSDKGSLGPGEGWQKAQTILNGNDIAKILGIQVAFANTLSKTLKFSEGQGKIHTHTANQVAPSQGYLYSWFDKTQGTKLDNDLRGRQKSGGAVATKAPGLMPTGDSPEERKRGVDEWNRVEGSKFVKGIDDRNMIFGAGRSGTTGELLKTYRVFAGTDSGEQFKQYLLAIVVYLVGGGHHTCHEIFSVANLLVGSNGPRGGRDHASVSTLVKDVYVPGKYMKHLPDSYLTTQHFKTLAEKYYDIAYLGHLHGTFV